MLRTLGRYLAGALVVCVLVVLGTGLRVIVVGSHSASPQQADAIVVLGAAEYNGRPSAVYAARLDHAAELFRENVASHILTIGGGQPGDITTEGAAGRKYLAGKGIDSAALISVGIGNDTLVSMRATAQVLADHGWNSVVLVTDPWHSARSQLMATDLGLHAQVSPVTTGPSVQPGVEPRYVTRETLGILFYLFTGGSSGIGPEAL